MKKIICIGEILWDILPSGKYPGGAPYNVAHMLNQFKLPAQIVSRIGNDELGTDLKKMMKDQGISSSGIQMDKDNITGQVNVELDDRNQPSYDILFPVAWDYIETENQSKSGEEDYGAVIFGTLAQRNDESKKAIRKHLKKDKMKVFDINLRHPFIDFEVIEYSLNKADILKLNTDELEQIQNWFNISGTESAALIKLAAKFDFKGVFLTRGDKGAKFFDGKKVFVHPGFNIKVKDPVGSGDAFLAAALKGYFEKKNGDEILTYANAVAAFVASKNGATPELDQEEIDELLEQSL